MTKWIGGATAAIILAFGSVLLAADVLQADDQRIEPQAVTLDDAMPMDEVIPVDEAALDNPALETEPVMVSDPVVQPVPVATAEPAIAPRPKPKPKSDKFVVKRILPIEGPLKYGEWHWDDEGVPPGPLVMTVDLDARVLSVFQGGYEIGATAVLLGTQTHPTPLGTFPILTKEKDNISEKYNNTPMPYTLRLTWDGIAIHGSEVENGYASHGCVGAPNDFAAKLFAIAKKGDKVIITRGKTMSMGDAIL